MEQFIDLILLFFLYSFIGWCIEVVLKYRQYGRFINRGFLTGPWLPIYGSGAVLITVSDMLITNYESAYGTTFAMSFVLCGLIEYLASYIMEKRFHARWWDYSSKPMNLNGRVWIGNLVLFGLGGVIIIWVTNPPFLRAIASMRPHTQQLTAGILSAILIADFVTSQFVLNLVKVSVERSETDSTEEINTEIRHLLHDRSYFHSRFADAYPEVIYRTERITARLERIKSETERLRQEAEARLSELSEQIGDGKAYLQEQLEDKKAYLQEQIGDKKAYIQEQFDDGKAYLQEQIEDKKAYLQEQLEPISITKNTMLRKQSELIELLYDEATATDEMRQLKEEIGKKSDRLSTFGIHI